MSTPESVLGVLGLCWVVFRTQHTESQRNPWPVGVCVGCVGFTRPRTHARIKKCGRWAAYKEANFPHAKAGKPNTPNTPNTHSFNVLISLGFKCVGCVLGFGFLCWVGILAGETAR